jgi:hypothetical protein
MQVRIAAEKRVQAAFEPISVRVAPGRKFSPEDVSLLEHAARPTGLSKVHGGRESGRTTADDERLEQNKRRSLQ